MLTIALLLLLAAFVVTMRGRAEPAQGAAVGRGAAAHHCRPAAKSAPTVTKFGGPAACWDAASRQFSRGGV